MSVKRLVELFNRVSTDEKVPETWKKGIIVKLPKKEDLSQCGNWRCIKHEDINREIISRCINLLSVPGKIFCRVKLNRIKSSIDKVLREEQVGFTEGRSCTGQIFVLRIIIEQFLEWNSSIYVNFIDFKKAFDSVHHDTLWKILQLYGVPQKIINILSNMYADNLCCVRHGEQHSEWFTVKSGVRKGCVISPILFQLVIDWVMKKSTAQKARGITWKAFNHLEDDGFADDIVLLSHSCKDMQKTTQIEMHAKTVGLKINHTKCKIMRVNANTATGVQMNNKVLENVNEFKYLGSYLNADEDINREITSRIAMASIAFQRLNAIW
ncbi:endonuclease-reverse transcriptase [Elysia marginata]|uniref:Endonuclease-reverse transcriptase n=1 Tax=Elysia marginata TaxID=1093978 RepID=A0AAV4GMZ6_9GAST|nr:endonuclease-reverse transcriptase [Elysia marginata]